MTVQSLKNNTYSLYRQVPWRYLLPSLRWCATCIGLWISTVIATRVGLPRINPDYMQEPTSMEQMGTVLTAIAVSFIAKPLRDPLPWSLASSPRRSSLIRCVRLFFVLLLSLLGFFIAGLLLPTTIANYQRFLGVLLYLSFFFLSFTFLNMRFAMFINPFSVLIFALRGLVPWTWNFIFNPDVPNGVGVVLMIFAAISVILWICLGDADNRRALSSG